MRALQNELQRPTDSENLSKIMFLNQFSSQIDENACQNLLGAADMLTAGQVAPQSQLERRVPTTEEKPKLRLNPKLKMPLYTRLLHWSPIHLWES